MVRQRNLEWKSDLETDIDNLLDKYLSLSVNLKEKDDLKTKIINLMYDLKRR